mgnify:CR=1 FL=1
MRPVNIIVFILALGVASGLVAYLNPWGYKPLTFDIQPPMNPIREAAKYNPALIPLIPFSDFVTGVHWFMGMVGKALSIFPTLLTEMGVPQVWVNALFIMVTISLVIYLIHMVSRSSVGE